MSELEDRFVKRGFWINWDDGYIMGQTYTVEGQTGILIVALLTILVSVAMAQLWNLFTFIFHQMLAHGDAADGSYWQHQALLRTMPTPTAFMADSIKISWRWKSKIPQSLFRSSSLLLAFAACFSIASIAGSISTSYAVDNSNIEVLVNSPFCGRVNYTKVFAVRTTSTLMSSLAQTMDSYATNCYQNSSSLPALCRNTFSRPNISYTAIPAPCPWNETMCNGGALPAIAMDSGLLDMRTNFGLNVEEKDTVKFRKRTVCNVLPREGHIFTRGASYWKSRGFNDNRTFLTYGNYRNTPAELRPETTFLQSTVLTENQVTFWPDAIFGYVQPDASEIGITPLPDMQREDSDLGLAAIWLNDVSFEQPANDELFTAHRESTYIVGGGYPNYTRYKPDFPAGVVGCALQYQFCHPRSGKDDFCTQLSGSPHEISASDYPDATPIQLSILTLLRSITRLSSVITSPLTGNVQASKTVIEGSSPGVPDNQWVKEIIGWEAFAWTGYQMLLSASVIGPKVFDEYADEYRDVPTTAGDKQLCQSLKMRKSGGFANINVFALILITAFSAVISLVNFFILRFCIFLSRFRKALAPRIDRWIQDGIFQLQRRAFEAQREGRWVDLEKEIPTTKERDMLSELPVRSLPTRLPKADVEPPREKSRNAPEDSHLKHQEDEKLIQALQRMDSELTLREDYGRMRSISGVCKKT